MLALCVAFAACVPATTSPAPTSTPGTSVAPTAATSEPTPTAGPSSAPGTPAATEASTAPACEPADLKASHGLVEGAAGSRFTTVVLTAAVVCSVDAFPAFGLRDAKGAVLVGAAASGPGRIDVVAGASYESNVRLANWCADDPAFPLSFELIVGGAEVDVTGASSFPEEGDLPPCNGVTQGRVLEATAWLESP